MGRVSTCQKNCNTIDLRGAQVNNDIAAKDTHSEKYCIDEFNHVVQANQ